MRKFLWMLLLIVFAGAFVSIPVCAAEVVPLDDLGQTEIPKVVLPGLPQIEVALPDDVPFEKILIAEEIELLWENISFTADFSDALNAAGQIPEEKLMEAMENLHISAKDAAVYVCPYLDIKIQNMELVETDSVDSPRITLDVWIRYHLLVSKENETQLITSGAGANAALLSDEALVLNVNPETGVEIAAPLINIFNNLKDSIFIEDTQDRELVFYNKVDVNEESSGTFMKINKLGQFTLIADPRRVAVDYQISEGTAAQEVYDVTAINRAEVPEAVKEGYRFVGWRYVGVAGDPYTGEIVGEALFDALYEAYALNFDQPVVAIPVFVKETGDVDNGDDSSEDEHEEEEDIPADSEEVIEEAVDVEAVKENVPPATGDTANTAVYVVLIAMAMIGMPIAMKKK